MNQKSKDKRRDIDGLGSAETRDFLAKLLPCSFLMDQPQVTRPRPASALALKMLSEPMTAFPLGKGQALSRVWVWGVRGRRG